MQDIALLRTAGYDIISTNRGYILNAPHTITRVFKVSHTDAQTEDELYSIVDLGGTVVNVWSITGYTVIWKPHLAFLPD